MEKFFINDQGVLKDITKMNKEDLFQFRKQVQMVFQDPYSSLNPVKKIYNAFEEPLKAHGFHKREERERNHEKKSLLCIIIRMWSGKLQRKM